MKSMIKTTFVCLFLTLAMTVLPGITALAAVEKIDTVKLTFSYDQAPKAGESPGTVTARTTSRKFTVESAEYINDVEVWKLGDKPKVKVVLNAEDGYRFSYTSASHFKLSGRGADFIKARIYDSGASLHLESYLNTVDGKPGQIDGLEWDGSFGMWNEAEESVKHYEVRLYRNKKLATTVTTSNTSYDFRSHITQEGDYTFRVRSIARYEDRAGSWSEYSDENTFTEGQAASYNKGAWIQNHHGWWYRYNNGDYPANCWKNINHVWYYFNQDGYMLNGWQFINGYWFYLDGSGAMLTGWQFINGRWYYMNGDGVMLTGWQFINGYWFYLDGSGAMLYGWQFINGRWYYMNGDGVMLTGWQFINGSWYYMDGSGAMYENQRTPDGYYVDGSGRYAGM